MKYIIEQLKSQDRTLRKVDRDLARDRSGLERQEKLLVGSLNNKITTCYHCVLIG